MDELDELDELDEHGECPVTGGAHEELEVADLVAPNREICLVVCEACEEVLGTVSDRRAM